MSIDLMLMIGEEHNKKDRKWEPVKLCDVTNRKIINDEEFTDLDTAPFVTTFRTFATVELHRLPKESKFFEVENTNHDDSHYWEWPNPFTADFDSRDDYWLRLKPVPLLEVLSILKDEHEGLRGSSWAIPLLEAMKDDPRNFSVLLYYLG